MIDPVLEADVAVVGAGPAGLAASAVLGQAGLSVVLLDENAAPGGQIDRALPGAFVAREGPGVGPGPRRRSAELLAALQDLPVRRVLGATVWGAFAPHVLEAVQDDVAFQVKARATIVAAGAHDRPVPVPGWTLPGVLTVGGAQTLLKAQRLLPGRRFVFAGTGPLLLVVAAQYAAAGAEIAAVVESTRISRLARELPSLLAAPGLMGEGLGYRRTLFRRGVPWLWGHVLTRVEGADEVSAAVVGALDARGEVAPGRERVLAADTVCVGYGLVPSVELLSVLGCRLEYSAPAASWVPVRSERLETTVPGVFAAGDGAGIAGAVVAEEEGRMAATGVAAALGALDPPRAEASLAGARRRLRRLTRFRRAVERAFPIPRHVVAAADGRTIVCRCEEVTAADIAAALADGAGGVAQVKAWTRAGMGPCQGRMCFLPVAHAVAGASGVDVAEVGPCRVRPPVKPVRVAALVDERA